MSAEFHGMLACGPYFDEAGLVASLALLLLIKPLSYYAYVSAYRYRVCAAIPMTVRQAVWLAFLRAVLGLVLVGGGALLMNMATHQSGELISWIYLYAARIAAWWIVGRVADLRGWRMVGWIAGGEAINVAFDIAVVAGLSEGILPAVIAVAVIAVFIAILHRLGRRPSLLARFAANPHCPVCQYNLTGNLSGICPECGTPIRLIGSAPGPVAAPTVVAQ